MAARLEFDGERVVPGETPAYLSWGHAARYRFARRFVDNHTVLDAGCGAGYGTSYLAQYAKRAVGVDVSPEAVEHARACYPIPNLSYEAMDCTALEFASGTFDVVCSFEVFEHLQEPERFLSEVQRVLVPGGLFVVSTPNNETEATDIVNPFHVKEYSLRQMNALLGPHFASVEYYGQFCLRPLRRYLFLKSTRLYLRSRAYRGLINAVAPLYLKRARASAPQNDPHWVERVNTDTFDFRPGAVDRATNIVAVCRTAAYA